MFCVQATVLSTDREVVDEWSAPEVPITTHDVTDSVVTVMIAHYVMLLAGRKIDGVTGCKYARWQDATDAIVGAVLMGLLETLGYVSKDLKYDDIVVKIHNKKTRSSNEAGPSSVKKENEDKYSQWDAVWGKFFTAQRRPSSWEKLIALALKFKEGILPDPRYFTVKSLFVTDAMAKHIDEGFQQLVADKDITLKAAILEFTKTFNVSFEEAQSAHDYEELQRQQAAAAAAEKARIAAEAAAAAAEEAAAAAEAAAALVPETPEAKRAKIAAEMAKAKAAYEAQMKALQEEEDMGEWDTESQALMGALILKAVAKKEVKLKKGWTLQQLRLWIQEPNLWSPVGLAYEHVRAIPIRHLAKKGLSLYNVLGDGNCFFHASCVWQGTYHPQAHAEERAATAHFAENLVQLYQKLVAANQVPPDLPPLMSVLPHNQTEPVPLGLWYPAHLAKLGAWTHPNVLALYSLLRGIPLYLLDKGLSVERPWYTQGFTHRFGLSPEQVASCRPPGYKPGLDGEAMYMLLVNNNHYMVLGRADGTRLRDGEVDLLQLAEEVNAEVRGTSSPQSNISRSSSTLTACSTTSSSGSTTTPAITSTATHSCSSSSYRNNSYCAKAQQLCHLVVHVANCARAAAITTTELLQAGQLVAEPARGVDDSVPFDAAQVLKISRTCDDESLRRLSPNSPYPHYLGTLEIDVVAARLTVEYGRERSFMICDIWMTCNLLKDDPNPVDYTRYARPTRHEDMWLKSRGFRQWSDVDALLLPLNISEQHWVLVVAYPKRGVLVLWDSLPVGCTLMYTNNISMLTAHWTLVNTTFPTDLLVVHVSLVQKPGGLDVWRWDRIRRWCSGVLGVSEWRYIIGAVDQQRDGNTCGDRIILAMEHLCRDMYMTRLTITEAEVAKLRPTLLKTLRAASGWTTLVAPYKEEFPDFASLPPPGPYVPDPNPTMIDLCTQEEQMTLDQDVTILDSQGDPGQKQAAAVVTPPLQFEPDLASVPPPMPNVPDPDASEVGLVTEEEETSLDHVMTIPDTQQDLSPEQPRAMPWNKVVDVFFTKEEQQAFPRAKTFAEQGLITEEQQKMWDQAMAEKEKLASGACSQDDGEAAPVPCSQDAAPIPCSQLDNPLKRPREQAEQLQAPSAREDMQKPCHPAIAGTGYFGSLVDYDDEALPPKPATADDSELTVTEELKHEAKATLNPADKPAKGRTTRVRSSKEALAEANTPPVTPKEVWAAPSHPLLEPEVLAVETKEQRIAFARHVEKKGFGVFRLPERLQPSRFPKLLWALLFLVVEFAEVIFKEGTFDEHGNPTDQGDWLGTDFGTGQRLQMTVTSTNAEGKLSDSSEIAELSTPWAARQWEDMKAKAGGMVEQLNRQVQMAADVASKYLSMLMPFIEEVAGGNIRGGTIIGNDFRHMRKVVTYGTANNFHYSAFPAYRTVEAQVVHMDVQPDPRNDSAEVTAKLDAAKADPDAIQRFRDGMVFIIAIQTFFLLLLPHSVGWVMVAERHAEAVFGENPTAAQVAAYEAELGGMKPLKAHRVKVEAGQCVCIRGYLLHAGDEGQANTMSVRIHFYSSPGFKPGETTYVHGLGKLFCSNVMPTVKPRHGWPLAAEFEVYRDVMVELPPYSPPLVAEHEKHYQKQWDDELPTQLITGLKQIAKAAARKAKVEAEAEQKVQEKAAKRARSVARPPQHFEP
ncbi:hypothetical protein QJQ45_002750 [Haematococcus lacustris]|nr:hypothetical protein QJQ45_002750 [Haematococcus lacustris]